MKTKRASGVLNYNAGIFCNYLNHWVDATAGWRQSFNIFDMSVTDEFYVDETRVWRTKL